MNKEKMIKAFDYHSNSVCVDFCKVKHKRSESRDVHVFLSLLELVPSSIPIIDFVCNGLIFLSTNIALLADVITLRQIIELVCCGVLYSYEYESLYMLV